MEQGKYSVTSRRDDSLSEIDRSNSESFSVE